jgi:cilia- and flagella-associated protein 57
MAIATEKSRRFLAVGEYIEMEASAIVSIFDLKNGAYFKRMRQVGFSDAKIDEFNALAFSNDSKLLVASSISNENIAIVWDWHRDKPIAKYSFPSKLSKITFSPKDPYLLCTSGQGLWKNWKIDEKSFKPQPPFSGLDKNKNYVDHCWLEDDVIVSIASSGEAFIAKINDFSNLIQFPFGKQSEKKNETKPTSVLCGTNKIFFGSNQGIIAIWSKVINLNLPQGESYSFEFIRSWSLGRVFSITSLTLSQNEEVLGFSLINNDIGVCNVSKVMQEEIEVKVDVFCQGFHKGPITGMDVAIQRPLIATCSAVDSSVRIWNYTTFRCEVAKKLRNDKDSMGTESINRPLVSVAFHPSGYYLAVGFEDKVRIFHVLFEDLRFFRELNIKNSTCMRFSNGGHYLAASSQKVVYIYTSFTLEQVIILRNHSSPVQDLCWSSDDQKLVTVAFDGGVYIMDTSPKESDHFSKNTEFSSVTFIENDSVVACGLESQVSVLYEQGPAAWKMHSIGLRPRLSQIHYFKSFHGNSCFISGCQNGSVQIYGPNPSNTIIEEIVAHNGSILKIRNSYDGRYVFTAGEDGVIFIYHVIEPKDTMPQLEKLDNQAKEELMIRNVDEKLADIVLIPKSQLENFKSQLEANRQAMENIRQKRDYSLQQQEVLFEEKRKELEKELHNEYKTLESKYDKIRDEKMKKEREWVERLSNIVRAHKNAIESAESLYEKKLTLEDDKFRKLDKEKQELKQYYEEQISVLQKQNEEAIENLAVAFKESLKKTQDDYEETRKTAEDLKRIYEERLSQQEDEHEAEIQEIKKKYEKQVEDQTLENTALRRNNESLINEQQKFAEEKEVLQIEDDKKISIMESLEKNKNDLLSQVKILEQDKKEKEDLLIQKEGKIYEYKFQIKDLDKKKHVLDARKKEILEELQPKDEEISLLQQEMQKIHNECDKERAKNTELKKNIKDREDQVKRLRGEGKSIHNQTEERERSLRAITNDIYNIVNNLEQKDWASELDKLYEKYVKKELSKVRKKDPECIEEMEEQLKYMEKSKGFMEKSQNQVLHRSKSDLRKRTIENSTLIEELRDLRDVKKNNELKIKDLEHKIKTKKQNIVVNTRSQLKSESKQASNSNLSSNVLPLPAPRPVSSIPSKSSNKGKIYKGSPFESKLVNIQEKQRISEIQKELEEKKEENFYLKLEINELREQLEKTENEALE